VVYKIDRLSRSLMYFSKLVEVFDRNNVTFVSVTGYAGEHKRLIDQMTWDRVHSIIQEIPRLRANNTRASTPALLKGLLYGEDGAAFSPTHTRKGDRLYRYYVSQTVLKYGAGTCPLYGIAQIMSEFSIVAVKNPKGSVFRVRTCKVKPSSS
jgi:hypothetical protein